MEFLMFWITTVVLSFVMEISNELRVFKDVADAGYKIKINDFSDITNKLMPDASKVTLMQLLVPVLNILSVMQRGMEYLQIRPRVLDQLFVLRVLEEMTEDEKEKYLKRPTGINALILMIKSELDLEEHINVELEDGSKIDFKLDEENKINIIRATGFARNLSKEEQIAKVEEVLDQLLVDVLSYDPESENNDLEIKKDRSSINIEEERKQLLKMQEMLREKRANSSRENEEENDKDDIQKLTRNKK